MYLTKRHKRVSEEQLCKRNQVSFTVRHYTPVQLEYLQETYVLACVPLLCKMSHSAALCWSIRCKHAAHMVFCPLKIFLMIVGLKCHLWHLRQKHSGVWNPPKTFIRDLTGTNVKSVKEHISEGLSFGCITVLEIDVVLEIDARKYYIE